MTTSSSPLFTDEDFVAPFSDGVFAAADNTRIEVRFTGNRLSLRVDEKGKVCHYEGGAVPMPVPGYVLVQITPTTESVKNGPTFYVPVKLDADTAWFLSAPAQDAPIYDDVFIRHGFTQGEWGWRHESPLDRRLTLSFYGDLIAAVALDPWWNHPDGRAPFAGQLFRRV